MRKIILPFIAAGAIVASAAPADGQYFPQPQPYGDGHNGYGSLGQVRALEGRLDSLEYQIRMLDRRGMIRDERADRLKDEAERLKGQLRHAARNGLNPYELNDIQTRIARLQQRVEFASAERYELYGRGYGNGYHGSDRNRDHDHGNDDDRD